MSITKVGSGIATGKMPMIPAPEVNEPKEFYRESPGAGLDIDRIKAEVRAEMRGEMNAAVADIERRLGQAREIEQATLDGILRETVHAEDLNIQKHLVDGYALTSNSPGAGSIAWASLHIVYGGVDYTIDDGNTANKYAWFVKPGSGTTATLQTSNTLPTLGPNDALVFINNAGVPVSVLESSISYAVGPGVVGNTQLAPGAVTPSKLNVAAHLLY